MKITINRLAEEIKRFADEHLQLSSFYFGDFVDAVNDKDAVVYPLLVATPQPSTLTFKKANVVISFVVCDKYNEGDVFGVQQIHSDLMQIATDLRAYLRNVQDEAWLDHIEVGDTINVQPFINRGQDVTAGWVFTITFEIDDVMNYCAIPLVGSTPAPPFSCEPATVIVLNSDGTQVDGGTVASGDTGTFEAPDSTAVLKDTAGTVLSTTAIPSDTSEDIIAPDALARIRYRIPSNNNIITFLKNIPSGGDSFFYLENTLEQLVKAASSNTRPTQTFVISDSLITLKNTANTTLLTTNVAATASANITAPDGQAINSNASFTLSVPSGGTAPIPDSQINVNGNNEGDVVSVQPINVNLTDGTNPVAPDSVTLVGNDLTLVSPDIKWRRNPLWQPIPSTPAADTLYILWGVYEVDGVTEIVLDLTGGVFNVDWGDGNTGSFTGGATHPYSYAGITTPIITDEFGYNYKTVLIELTRTSGNVSRFWVQNGTGLIYQNRLLDVVLNFNASAVTNIQYRLSINNRYPRGLERFKTNIRGVAFMSDFILQAINLRVLDIPSNFFDTIGVMAFFLNSSGVLLEIGNIFSSTAQMNNAFTYSGVVKVGNINNTTVWTGNQLRFMFQFSRVREVGNIDFPNLTGNLAGFLQQSNVVKIGTINAPLITNIDNFANNCPVEELVFTDCALITGVLTAFIGARNLRKLITPNLTRGLDVRDTQLTGTNLQDWFTSLGTASGSQTITLPTFTIGEPTTIATTKGYTIAYA
jgi:hypothetical protein